MLGIETKKPIITDKSLAFNWTNEVGYGNSIRFLKNIVGLWIQQECRRAWAKEGQELSYTQLGELAQAARPLQALIDPADPRFAKPDNMPQKIADFCRETGQVPPQTPGETVRCVLESLACTYRRTLEQMEEMTGHKIKVLHIVGGGSQNRLLNQCTADAIGRTVLAGPVECTAIGNVLIQALALGHLESLAALRDVVRRSFALQSYQPQNTAAWDQAYGRFGKLGVRS